MLSGKEQNILPINKNLTTLQINFKDSWPQKEQKTLPDILYTYQLVTTYSGKVQDKFMAHKHQ